MRIDNTFDVSLPPKDAWALLQDMALVASCWPGAHLDGVVDGEYRGGLSAEIGPVSLRYTGTARFTERDEVDRRAVIQARGREEGGRGAASATITAVLSPAGGGTKVDVSTEMTMNGPAAQCGRSLLTEVSAGLVREFARCLEATITQDREAGAGADARSGHAGVSSEPVVFRRAGSAGRTAIWPPLRKATTPAAAAILGFLLGRALGRRSARRV